MWSLFRPDAKGSHPEIRTDGVPRLATLRWETQRSAEVGSLNRTIGPNLEDQSHSSDWGTSIGLPILPSTSFHLCEMGCSYWPHRKPAGIEMTPAKYQDPGPTGVTSPAHCPQPSLWNKAVIYSPSLTQHFTNEAE